MASMALLRLEDDYRLHFFHGHQVARMARMARLPATTALTPRATWTGRRRRIARRGTWRVAGSLVELLLQRTHLLL
jgi:hypothetical protein